MRFNVRSKICMQLSSESLVRDLLYPRHRRKIVAVRSQPGAFVAVQNPAKDGSFRSRLPDTLVSSAGPIRNAPSSSMELTQLKERVRQLAEESRHDQSLIFETYRKHGAVKDGPGRMTLNREVGDIQRRIAVRGQQMRGLSEQIAKLEAELSPPPTKEAK